MIPIGLVLDQIENIYFVDGCVLRKITRSSAIISTIILQINTIPWQYIFMLLTLIFTIALAITNLQVNNFQFGLRFILIQSVFKNNSSRCNE